MSLTEIAERQHALEESLAQVVADIVAMGTDLTATLAEGSHNVVTLTKQREGAAIEVQVIVKCGTAHEVRDDLWDAIINRQDMDVSATQLANAAMERLGFQEPNGGWPGATAGKPQSGMDLLTTALVTAGALDCPGHVATPGDPKRCLYCGTHVDEYRDEQVDRP